jgi:ParB family transcriptional regulator, chromosome partitioning protein
VEVKGSARRGRIVIEYAGAADLQRLLDILGRGSGHNLAAEDA